MVVANRTRPSRAPVSTLSLADEMAARMAERPDRGFPVGMKYCGTCGVEHWFEHRPDPVTVGHVGELEDVPAERWRWYCTVCGRPRPPSRKSAS
jgi:hypothetical protein